MTPSASPQSLPEDRRQFCDRQEPVRLSGGHPRAPGQATAGYDEVNVRVMLKLGIFMGSGLQYYNFSLGITQYWLTE